MPLTVRTNGSGGSNLIQAAWWNDYHDLFTGVMQDQGVTIKNNLTLQAIGGPPTTAPTAAPAAGTGLGVGVYKYGVTFFNNDGETILGPVATVTTTSGNTFVALSAIPTGPVGTTGRTLYRTKVGGASFFVTTVLSDNTTTTYTDSKADTALGSQVPPTSPSFGGALTIKDQNGHVNYRINTDGTVFLGGGNFLQIAGTSSGTATLWENVQGQVKTIFLTQSNFKNGTTTNGFSLPTKFSTSALFMATGINGMVVRNGGSAGTILSLDIYSSYGSGTTGTSVNGMVMGGVDTAFDWIEFTVSNASAHNGSVMIIGN